MGAKQKGVRRIDPKLASRILRSVSIEEAFLFFTDIGQYNGEFAPSLSDFFAKLEKIPLRSIEFHFKRRDFQKWIRTTIGDAYLASEINKIRESVQGEELRDLIHETVERRLTELKRQLAYEETYVEHE